MKRLKYEEFLDICNSCDMQPNRLFICIRKSLGISQRKLAYIINKEHISQNTISRYEHKNNISAEYEYVLWNYILGYMKQEFHLRRKADSVRYSAMILAAFNLYMVKYADGDQLVKMCEYMTDAFGNA